jgi:hypothetical protein
MANGSGTQQDPYIFSSFSELLEMQSEATNSTYYEYGGTEAEEDLNDIYPEGLSDSLSLTGIIDFKNLVISNLRSFAQYAIRINGTLKNLTLNNVVWTYSGISTAYFIYGALRDVFYNVKIYATVYLTVTYNSNTFIITDTTSSGERKNHVDKCVIRLKGFINNTAENGLVVFNTYAMVKDCNIIFDDFVCSNNVHIKQTLTMGGGFHMIGCYIGGKITTDSVKDTYGNSDNNSVLVSTYNIFNVETEATFTHRGYGFNIFNSTKAPNFVSDTETNIIGVTDSRLKDALYLQSIGFPCYRGE